MNTIMYSILLAKTLFTADSVKIFFFFFFLQASPIHEVVLCFGIKGRWCPIFSINNIQNSSPWYIVYKVVYKIIQWRIANQPRGGISKCKTNNSVNEKKGRGGGGGGQKKEETQTTGRVYKKTRKEKERESPSIIHHACP